jgi:ABC-type transport system involved in multi-copper enzyme maturation permease subunit
MRTTWHSLTWKEWHEHKWKLAAITTIMLGSLWLASYPGHDFSTFSNFYIALVMVAVPSTVFVGMATASSERSRKTLPFLIGLPIPRRKIAVVKLLAGLGTSLAPLLIGITALLLWWSHSGDKLPGAGNAIDHALIDIHGPIDAANWFSRVSIMLTVLIISLFLWTAVGGVNSDDEVSAGAWALSIMAGVWGIAAAALLVGEPFRVWLTHDGKWLAANAEAILPAGFAVVQLRTLSTLVGVAAVATFSMAHALLATWYIQRFGIVSDRTLYSPKPAAEVTTSDYVPAKPRHSQLSAIAWKQFRESGPTALVGLIGAFAIAVVTATVTHATHIHRDFDPPEEFSQVFGTVWFVASMYLGAITALVIGIGIFLRDLEPALHTFWLSRPISVDRWYWTKFVSGLAVVALAFQLPMLLLAFLGFCRFGPANGRFNEVLMTQGISLAIFVAVFAVAVAITCLVRHAVYAGILTIAATYLGTLAVVMPAVAVHCIITHQWNMRVLDGPAAAPMWIAGLAFDAIVGTLLGWLAVRCDWGRRNG